MFGTYTTFSRSVNPDHSTVSKTATQLVCNTHQSTTGTPTTEGQKQQIVPLPSMAACPSLPSTPQQPNSQPVATLLGSLQCSHAPPCCLGHDQMSPTPGPTVVPCRAQPSHQHVAMCSGQVLGPDPKYFD